MSALKGQTPTDPLLRRRFFRLTALNILSNLTVPLASLVDAAMLGHLPQIRYLAGTALAAVLFDYLYWSFGFLRMSTTGLAAQAVGRGDRDEEYLTLYRAVALGLMAGTAILAFHPLLREVGFFLLTGPADVENAGRDYFQGRIWGAPAVLCNFALLGWFLGREEAQKALLMNVIANLANILLNYLFIVRFGWAAFGAGLATMASQYAMLAVGLALFLREGAPMAFSAGAVLERCRLGALLSLNRDILLRTLGLITAFGLFANFSALMGTAVLAANVILQRFLTTASFAIDGIAFASESLAGIYRGRGDQSSLKRLVRISLGLGFALGAVFVAAMASAGKAPYSLLTSHPEVAQLAWRYSPGLYAVILLGAWAYCFDGIFLGLTSGRLLRNAMLTSAFLVFLPLAAVAVGIGSNAVLWIALAFFMASRAALLGLWGRRELKGENPDLSADRA